MRGRRGLPDPRAIPVAHPGRRDRRATRAIRVARRDRRARREARACRARRVLTGRRVRRVLPDARASPAMRGRRDRGATASPWTRPVRAGLPPTATFGLSSAARHARCTWVRTVRGRGSSALPARHSAPAEARSPVRSARGHRRAHLACLVVLSLAAACSDTGGAPADTISSSADSGQAARAAGEFILASESGAAISYRSLVPPPDTSLDEIPADLDVPDEPDYATDPPRRRGSLQLRGRLLLLGRHGRSAGLGVPDLRAHPRAGGTRHRHCLPCRRRRVPDRRAPGAPQPHRPPAQLPLRHHRQGGRNEPRRRRGAARSGAAGQRRGSARAELPGHRWTAGRRACGLRRISAVGGGRRLDRRGAGVEAHHPRRVRSGRPDQRPHQPGAAAAGR